MRCRLAPAGEMVCDEPAVVEIVDRYGSSCAGCHPHAVRALRGIEGARVYPLPGHRGEGHAIAVWQEANR